nr:MAG TPA: hypothetical protein [Caudoviricetes sp.]
MFYQENVTWRLNGRLFRCNWFHVVACGPFVLAYFDFIFSILFHIVIIWYICTKNI